MLALLEQYVGASVSSDIAVPVLCYMCCITFVCFVDLVYRLFKHFWR